MASKRSEKKTVTLSIAMAPADMALLEKAATITGIPKSIEARAVLLDRAKKIIGEAKGK